MTVAAAIAIAASAAAVVLGLWAASLHHSLAHDRTALNILGDPSARHVAVSGAPGQLVVAPSGAAVLAVRLPSPPKGKTYEAWVADERCASRRSVLRERHSRCKIVLHPVRK